MTFIFVWAHCFPFNFFIYMTGQCGILHFKNIIIVTGKKKKKKKKKVLCRKKGGEVQRQGEGEGSRCAGDSKKMDDVE